MKTKLHYVFSFAMLFLSLTFFGQNKFVKISNGNSLNQKNGVAKEIKSYDSYQINEVELRTALQSAPLRGDFSGKSSITMKFPTLTGEMETFRIVESTVMHPTLQALYPKIRSYIGYSEKSSKRIWFSISPYNGLNAIILGGESTVVYESYQHDVNKIKVYDKAANTILSTFECSTIDKIQDYITATSSSNKDADDSQLRTYRLAMSVSGEYSDLNGGSLPLINAAIAKTITNVNAVFENDFNVHLQIIPNNNTIVYLDASTDPYDGTTDDNYSDVLASTLNTNIGEVNYDIGHLMGGIGNNGNAGCVGCVCNSGGTVANQNHKGSGYSTSTTPKGINFDIDFVAHKIGHQFGATHTFTYQAEGNGISQMEPGSGTTIMGYAGITGATDVQPHSDSYFHAISIQQVTTYVKTKGLCSVNTPTGNTSPTVNAGNDVTLPVGTAFKLTGTGNDINGDNITYCWEQFDENNGQTPFPDPNSTNSNIPLFRSYLPTENPTRTFPKLSSIVTFGVNGYTWEKVPSVTRNADFRLTVRDNKANGANNKHDDMRVNFDNSYGPFAITSQSTENLVLRSNTSETITWSVNNTSALSGAANVNIMLSTDGGKTFPTVLASNTPNDGSQIITVPNMPAPYCRILIEPTGNQFFAINTVNFSIDYEISTSCENFTSTPNYSIPDDDETLVGLPITSTSTAVFGENVYAKVSVNISHTYIGDLVMAIQSPAPANTFVLLAQQPCNQDRFEDLNVTFADGAAGYSCASPTIGIVEPSQPLADFNGDTASGQWVLGIADVEPADTGMLKSWSLDICTRTLTRLSIEENELLGFSMYPNPNKGKFTLKLKSNSNQDIKVQVYDLRGRMVFNNSYANTQDFNQVIDLYNVQSGLYMLNVTDGFKKVTKKMIIK